MNEVESGDMALSTLRFSERANRFNFFRRHGRFYARLKFAIPTSLARCSCDQIHKDFLKQKRRRLLCMRFELITLVWLGTMLFRPSWQSRSFTKRRGQRMVYVKKSKCGCFAIMRVTTQTICNRFTQFARVPKKTHLSPIDVRLSLDVLVNSKLSKHDFRREWNSVTLSQIYRMIFTSFFLITKEHRIDWIPNQQARFAENTKQKKQISRRRSISQSETNVDFDFDLTTSVSHLFNFSRYLAMAFIW